MRGYRYLMTMAPTITRLTHITAHHNTHVQRHTVSPLSGGPSASAHTDSVRPLDCLRAGGPLHITADSSQVVEHPRPGASGIPQSQNQPVTTADAQRHVSYEFTMMGKELCSISITNDCMLDRPPGHSLTQKLCLLRPV